jgi:hypothetical protein
VVSACGFDQEHSAQGTGARFVFEDFGMDGAVITGFIIAGGIDGFRRHVVTPLVSSN